MKNIRLIGQRWLGFMLPVSLLISGVTYAADVRTVAAAVDAHYNHLRTLRAQFTELYRGSG
ncbi:MAG: hypothetical protein ACRD3B_13290, partial [Candidatus Sulfotelmatobacter sp.]